MLVDLLRNLSESGGIVTSAEMARKLKVSESHLRMLIDELVRLGYLEDLRRRASGQGACEATCHCSGCSGCPADASNSPPMWEITEKGQRLLQGKKLEP